MWLIRLWLHLGIEFYLFVSHGGMNDRGPTCKFRNARSAFRNLNVDPVFHTSMRSKQVEFNLYIYTLSKLSRFGQEISVFNTHQAAGTAISYVTYPASWKNGCQNFSYVHRSRIHWKCEYCSFKVMTAITHSFEVPMLPRLSVLYGAYGSLEIVQTIGCFRKAPRSDGMDRNTGKITCPKRGLTKNLLIV